MSSFLSSQSRLRRGKWTAEEEVYASCIMEAFKEGSLNDVQEGLSLRGYLAEKLRTNVKRISKKYEGTNYNGKRVYLEKTNLPPEVVGARRAKLKELELKFEKSVKLMEDAESAKKDMARLNGSANFMASFPSSFTMANGLQAPSVFPSSSLAAQAAFVSRDVMDENMRILARQSTANSIEARRSFIGGGLGSALNMASFGSLTNYELQALMGGIQEAPPSPRAVAAAAFPVGMAPSVSGAVLNQMIMQQQQDAVAAEILARQEAEAAQAQVLFAGGTASSRALHQRPPSPPGARLAMKRPPQLQPFLGPPSPSTKRAKLY